jgi:hypothetical protein
MSFRLSRRAFLRGASAAGASSSTVWLPTLECMLNGNGTALANGAPLARRFIEFFWGVSYSTLDGKGTWAPRSDSGPLPAKLPYYFNTDERYQAKLKSLAAQGVDGLGLQHLTPSLSDPGIRKYVRIIDGVSSRHLVKDEGHHWQSLLGVVTLPRHSEQYTTQSHAPKGPTLERFIGSYDHFREGISPHVHLAVCPVQNRGSISMTSDEHRVSVGYSGMKNGKFDSRSQQLREPAQFDPLQVFEELFGASGAGAEEDPVMRRRRSVLDGVLRASAGTLGRLGNNDRQLVDAHLDTVRQIEKNITATARCSRVMAPKSARTPLEGGPGYSPQYSNRTAPRVAKDMRDLAALMISCDYTRCLTFVVTPALSGFDGASFLDFSSAKGVREFPSLHRDSHDQKEYHRLVTPWHMGQLAALIQMVTSIREGGGSAIDNTLIWATSEQGPQVHSTDDIATIVAGGPKLVRGNYYDRPSAGQRPMADMHLGLMAALGLPTAEYIDYVRPTNPRPISFV